MKFNPLTPELYVSHFQKSFDFYTKILGFTVEYQRENPLHIPSLNPAPEASR